MARRGCAGERLGVGLRGELQIDESPPGELLGGVLGMGETFTEAGIEGTNVADESVSATDGVGGRDSEVDLTWNDTIRTKYLPKCRGCWCVPETRSFLVAIYQRSQSTHPQRRRDLVLSSA